MLKNQILSTLRFFDLQDWPLTLPELHKFLIADLESIKLELDGELLENNYSDKELSMGEVLEALESECQGTVENLEGFYYLAGRREIVKDRLENYLYGIKREKLIKKYIGGLKYLPFIRGVGLTGSQALGQQKPLSDIDLFILVEPKFIWLARTLVTAHFQILGLRRYGGKIANRFCLNHYLAEGKKIGQLRNLYTAMEYIKLRPLVYAHGILEFQKNNSDWMQTFFPNWQLMEDSGPIKQPSVQRLLESLFNNACGRLLEKLLKRLQLPRIKKEEFILVSEDELSFHPGSKQQKLLVDFFKLEQ